MSATNHEFLSNSSSRIEEHTAEWFIFVEPHLKRDFKFSFRTFFIWAQARGRGRLHLIAIHINWFSCSTVENVCMRKLRYFISIGRESDKEICFSICSYIELASARAYLHSNWAWKILQEKKNYCGFRVNCFIYFSIYQLIAHFSKWVGNIGFWPCIGIQVLVFFHLFLLIIRHFDGRDINGWHLVLRTKQKHIFHNFAGNRMKITRLSSQLHESFGKSCFDWTVLPNSRCKIETNLFWACLACIPLAVLMLSRARYRLFVWIFQFAITYTYLWICIMHAACIPIDPTISRLLMQSKLTTCFECETGVCVSSNEKLIPLMATWTHLWRRTHVRILVAVTNFNASICLTQRIKGIAWKPLFCKSYSSIFFPDNDWRYWCLWLLLVMRLKWMTL